MTAGDNTPPRHLRRHVAPPDWKRVVVPGNRMLAPRSCTENPDAAGKATTKSKDGAGDAANMPAKAMKVAHPGSGRTKATVSPFAPEPWSTQGPSRLPVLTGTPATDPEGRPFDVSTVVVNFANVGCTYGERVMNRKNTGAPLFDYEGVRRCVRHLTQELHLKVVGVVYENNWAVDKADEVRSVPTDIVQMCEESGGSIELTPRVTGQQHRSADDEMTIKCAYNRNCRFLDNDNYVDWRQGLHQEKIRVWLEKCQEFLQMRFYFDTGLGTFDTLDGNIPAAMLATGVRQQAHRHQARNLSAAQREA